MPLGEFTVRLRITGFFRDERDAANKIKEIVQDTVSREQREERRYQQDHSGSGSLGFSVGPHAIRRVEIV